ncbi:hypothetical protein PACTADRAFT_49088 [Pachysolen tannophilus NRRL Y-2460]|uniref:SSD domain-containing protein n=1 Tax=Pachysolen tannophilus NRRL Y-2460 TaxID=669874 RepID=A0A1E4U0B1_PACTA|nr:hypothetical protein PACTADRAFT_49088 [Pachysolen tannophilus NRRL Y-2460]
MQFNNKDSDNRALADLEFKQLWIQTNFNDYDNQEINNNNNNNNNNINKENHQSYNIDDDDEDNNNNNNLNKDIQISKKTNNKNKKFNDDEDNRSNALQKTFLLNALSLQKRLLEGIQISDNVHDGAAGPRAFVHSPLQFWGNNEKILENDEKILKTIHANSPKKSPTGVTLAHSSLFSGIVKVNGLVKSADALKISLFYKPNKDGIDAGDIWDQNLKLLKDEQLQNEFENLNFIIFNKEKNETKFKKIHMRIIPMKFADQIMLALTYICIVAYFVISLVNIHSVKSRIGLLIAFVVEVALSIFSAATITSYLFRGIDFFQMPSQILPFVVIVVGIENMFRLLNSILSIPDEMPLQIKLSRALTNSGLSSTLIVAADLLILIFVIPFVASSTRQFCCFALIALVIDHFLHLTYFTAVVSVDMRRLELENLLRRSNAQGGGLIPSSANRVDNGNKKRAVPKKNLLSNSHLDISIDVPRRRFSLKNFFGESFFKIKLPFSTTVAGSVFMVVLLLIVNLRWIGSSSHINVFHQDNEIYKSSLPSSEYDKQQPGIVSENLLSSSVHLSDQFNISVVENGKFTFFLDQKYFGMEFAKLLEIPDKYDVYKLTILVEEPSIAVHKSAFDEFEFNFYRNYHNNYGNRYGFHNKLIPIVNFDLQTTYKFDVYYLFEFLTSLIFTASVASMILKLFIKTNDYGSMMTSDNVLSDDTAYKFSFKPPFNCKELCNGHFLDIINVTTSACPFIVSVGVDRKLLVWSPVTNPLPPPTELPISKQLWPITNVVMSDSGNFIAAFNKYGTIKCWSRLSMICIWTVQIDDLKKSKMLESFFRKRTAPAFSSRKKGIKSRLAKKTRPNGGSSNNFNYNQSVITEDDDKVNSSERSEVRHSRATSISSMTLPRSMSIDSTFDRSNNLKALSENTDYEFTMILSNGSMYIISCEDGSLKEEKITTSPLVSAAKIISPRVNDRLVCITDSGNLIVAVVINNKWKIRELAVQKENYNSGRSLLTPAALSRKSSFSSLAHQNFQKSPELRSQLNFQKKHPWDHHADVDDDEENRKKTEFENSEIATVSFVGMIVRTKGTIAELIDVQTGTLVKTFNIGQFKRGTFKVFHSPPIHCRFCGSASISSFSIVYIELDTNTLILHTFSIDNRAKNNICLRVERDPRETRCLGFERVTEHQHWLDNVEGWCLTDANMVMGIRRKEGVEMKDRDIIHSSSSYSTSVRSSLISNLKLKRNSGGNGVESQKLGQKQNGDSGSSLNSDKIWEGFTLDASGKVLYNQIPNGSDNGLFIKSIGPVAKFGHKSIVVTFGNVMKIFYNGNSNLFDVDGIGSDTSDSNINRLGFINRRKRLNVYNYQLTHSTNYNVTDELAEE